MRVFDILAKAGESGYNKGQYLGKGERRSMLKHCLIVFLVSMVPIIELRGAIPYGVGFGLPLWLTYCVAIVGNMLPVPVIYFFARRVLVWGSGKPGHREALRVLSGKGRKGRTEAAEKGGARAVLGAAAVRGHPTAGHRRVDPARWRPAFWIWTSRRACWPAWAAYCWRGSSWGC